jgi:hypothetical protein
MQTTHRFRHVNSDVVLPIKKEFKGVPSVYRQAEALNGQFKRIVHGLPKDSVGNFSPSMLNHNDQTFIAWRSQAEPFGFRYDNNYFYLNNAHTDIYLGQLVDDHTVLGAKKLRSTPHRLSYEDPRLFKGPDENLYVQFVTSKYASKYDQRGRKLFDTPKVAVCYVNELGDAVQTAFPPIGKNLTKGETEKNWCFFPHRDLLHCLYSIRPLVIEREGLPAIQVDSDILNSVTQGAPTFCSLPPVLIGSEQLIFYHWKHMTYNDLGNPYLVYHLSAFMTDEEFTEITHISPQPLFTGSLEDTLITWTDYVGNPVSNQPAVILPFGATLDGEELAMSLGVNDAFMGIFRCPVNEVLKKLVKAY